MITATGKASQRGLLITAETKNGKAYVRIVGRISDWNVNNSRDFQNKVDELVKVHDDCEVYINSQGGSVFEANEINNQLKRFKNVTVTIGSIAASAATYFIACYPTTVSSNSQIMIHKPMMTTHGNETEIQNQLKLLKSITKDYLAKYAKKTGKTAKQIEALWSTGDYWMSGTEAKDEGFVDFLDDEIDAVVTVEDIAVLEACGAPIIPKVSAEILKPKHTIKTKNIMDKDELIAFLGLEANATDVQIAEAKSKMKIDALKKREIDAAAKAKADAKEDEGSQDEYSPEAITLVEAGIKDKKFTAKEAEHYKAFATANLVGATAVINAMVKIPKLSSQLNTKNQQEDGDAVTANWTYDDYLTKDPNALEALWANDPVKAKALEASYLPNE
jgi:ATP-dependent Clp protease protease subunit